jgi:hypothetical protein
MGNVRCRLSCNSWHGWLLRWAPFLVLCWIPRASSSDCGASTNPTGNPIGGGAGYTQIVDRAEATYVVATKSELLSRLSTASSGDVIYVEDTATIDLTGFYDTPIPGGITIASGRGHLNSPGALLFAVGVKTFSTPSGVRALLKVAGENVRVTGLRIRGPDPLVGLTAYGSPRGTFPTPRGIACDGHSGLEVDNCELSGWPHAAIYLRNAQQAHIHHN